ncbi:MAG: hypothetical protein Kow00109_04410 [Acidobacteriota bacterium]
MSLARVPELLLSGFVATLLAGAALGQTEESPTYAQEYALYQQAQGETDLEKQKDLVLQFVKTYDKSVLDPHVAYLYVQYLNRFKERQQWQNLASAAEDYLQHRPSEPAVTALAVEAYQHLGQPEKLVAFGSRLYEKAPSAAAAYLVAKACQSMGDQAGLEKWAQRTLRHDPDNLEMLALLIQAAWSRQDLTRAAEYAQRTLKALEKAPDDEATQQVKAFAYRAVGEKSYIESDWSAAAKAFETAAELDPKIDFSHLRLGYCYWQQGKIDEAIMAFARAVALRGSSASEARQQLYTLLRQRFGNTSAATRYIDAAKKELGIQ